MLKDEITKIERLFSLAEEIAGMTGEKKINRAENFCSDLAQMYLRGEVSRKLYDELTEMVGGSTLDHFEYYEKMKENEIFLKRSKWLDENLESVQKKLLDIWFPLNYEEFNKLHPIWWLIYDAFMTGWRYSAALPDNDTPQIEEYRPDWVFWNTRSGTATKKISVARAWHQNGEPVEIRTPYTDLVMCVRGKSED